MAAASAVIGGGFAARRLRCVVDVGRPGSAADENDGRDCCSGRPGELPTAMTNCTPSRYMTPERPADSSRQLYIVRRTKYTASGELESPVSVVVE